MSMLPKKRQFEPLTMGLPEHVIEEWAMRNTVVSEVGKPPRPWYPVERAFLIGFSHIRVFLDGPMGKDPWPEDDMAVDMDGLKELLARYALSEDGTGRDIIAIADVSRRVIEYRPHGGNVDVVVWTYGPAKIEIPVELLPQLIAVEEKV